MALLFCDSFDHYSSGAEFFTKWSESRNNTPSPFVAGRFGNAWDGNERWSRKDFSSTYATLICGGAIRREATGWNTGVFGFWDAGTTQVDVRIVSDTNTIEVTRNGTVLGSATFVMSTGVFYYVEFKATISDASGVAVVKINGTTVINLSSVDTKNTANAFANQVRIGTHGDTSFGGQIDDFYICDNSGGTNNDFLGDVRVEAILPNGNGNSSVFVGSDGNSVDNYLLVDENPPNEDTDYVESPTVGDKDTYAFGNVTPTAGTVFGVQLLPYARKTDAGARSIKAVARLSGTEVDGAVDVPLSTSYLYYPDVRETKPGGGAWTITDVNNAEFGQKVTV